MGMMQDVTPAAAPPVDRRLWEGVDRALASAPRLDDVLRHQLGPLEARRLGALGRAVPDALVRAEHAAVIATLTAPVVLARAREAYEGRIVLMKGPAVAARYPDPVLRGFKDLDLLVEDAAAAQRALVGAGFQPVGDPALYDGIHHLRPLALAGLPLTVEVHSAPKWIDGLEPPTTAELVDAAFAGGVELEGVMALPDAHHAIVLAAHAWAHEPLRRLRDLVDVAAVVQGIDRDELRAVAAGWGVERAWRTTIGAADALFLGGAPPWAVRTWARNVAKARERTVLENHLARWLAPFWALPAPVAVRALGATLAGEIRPKPGEGWGAKLSRSGRAARNALRRRSEHERTLAGREGGRDGS